MCRASCPGDTSLWRIVSSPVAKRGTGKQGAGSPRVVPFRDMHGLPQTDRASLFAVVRPLALSRHWCLSVFVASEMLAATSLGQLFSVALWDSSIRSPAPFCDSRKGSHLRHSFSCHRSQAESIAPFPSQCFGGAAPPLLHVFDVCVRPNIIIRAAVVKGKTLAMMSYE